MLLVDDIIAGEDATRAGDEMYQLAGRLFPLCRSITGDGFRKSLVLLQERVPLIQCEVPTGTQVFDWAVPKEWNIRDAYIMTDAGKRVVDFRECNLHVVNYSTPVRQRMNRSELKGHVFTLPETPDWIPYRTSYYKEAWGFCMSQRQWETLPEGEYEVCIDSTLSPGHLTYGELEVPGETADEVLISCHSCHPSLANDNLSGMVVAAELARRLIAAHPRYSYRFLWSPGAIGAITWLALNEQKRRRIRHGLVLSCVGDPGPFTYKRTRSGNAEIDQAVAHVLKRWGCGFRLLDFTPSGYDERQYCSPGINLPVGCFMRTPNGKYAQYHTSADDMTLITPGALAESLGQLLRIISVLEKNHHYVNLNPNCEPQLGRRGLYRAMGGTNSSESEDAMLWVLNFSDGEHSLLEVADRSSLDFFKIAEAAELLAAHGLLQRCEVKSQ
jgi:aminopeptidase-like protein